MIALAGNKSDLAAKRMVEFEEAQAYADENGLLFMETSAKTAMNVNDIFLAIGELLEMFIVPPYSSNAYICLTKASRQDNPCDVRFG